MGLVPVRRLFLLVATACAPDPRPAIDDAPRTPACPTHLDMELVGTESRFDPGYSGLAHGVGLATGSNLSVAISECDESCRRCSFTGPVRPTTSVQRVVAQRCLGALATQCTTDDDCGVGGKCRFVFPPISSTFGVATCSLTYFEPIAAADPSAVQGVFDLQTGEMDMAVLNLVVSVSLGACDECTGDASPFDGVQGGTCTASGAACDVTGVGTLFAAQTSYDCPPPAPVIAIPLPGTAATTGTQRWTMEPSRPNCTASGATGKDCWCGMCSNGTSCITDSDCPIGTCGAATGPPGTTTYNTNNHSCTGSCNWDPVQRRGRCSNDATKPCFPDSGTIVAAGSSEVGDGFYMSKIATLRCMPSFGGFVDPAAGFPGPMLFEARFRVAPRTEP